MQCKQNYQNAKFQGIILKRKIYASEFKFSIKGQDIDFSDPIIVLGICMVENLTFDIHVNNICLKASRQLSALQRLTCLYGLPNRKTIYDSLIVPNI